MGTVTADLNAGDAGVVSSAGARKTRIFISYSRKDTEFVDRLANALAARGYHPYVDREDISGGEEWKGRLQQLMLQADAIAFVISPDSVASPICDWETKRALELGKRLIPVVWRPIATGAPVQLSRLNYIFADTEEKFQSAVAELGAACDVDIVWVREHTRLVELATRWDAGGRRGAALLRGGELIDAEAWLARRTPLAPTIPQTLAEYLPASRAAARRRVLIATCGTAALTLVAVGVALSVDALTWRTRLSSFGEQQAVNGATLNAFPFLLAGQDLGGAILPFRSDRANAALGRVASTVIVRDLGAFAGFSLAPGGAALVVHGADGAAVYYRLDRSNEASAMGNLGRLQASVLSSGGESLFTLGEDGVGRLRTPDADGAVIELGDLAFVRNIGFSANRSMLFVQRQDGGGVAFDLTNVSAAPLGDLGQVRSFSLSPDGERLVIQRDNGRLAAYDLRRSGRRQDLSAFGAVQSFKLSLTGALVLVRADGSGVVYDLDRGRVIQQLDGVRNFRLSADGARLVIVRGDGTGVAYNLQSGDAPRTLSAIGQALNLSLSHDGGVLLLHRQGGARALIDLKGEGGLRELGSHSDIAMSRDGSRIVTFDADGVGVVADVRGSASRSLGVLSDFSLSDDGASMVTVGEDGGTYVYDLSEGSEPRYLGHSRGFDLSDDGSVLIAQQDDYAGAVYDLRAEAPMTRGAALTRDLCAGSGETIRVFPAHLRDPALADARTNAEDRRVYQTLRGRPWHPCDWRGLGAGAEGWSQFVRLLRIRFLGGSDYACAERRAGGAADAVSRARCERARAQPPAMQDPESRSVRRTGIAFGADDNQIRGRLWRIVDVAQWDVLNMRQEASAITPVVESIPSGTIGVRTTGRQAVFGERVWVEVAYNGSLGWVNSQFLAPLSPATGANAQ